MKNQYGSLRKYKKFNRERGDFHNKSEQAFENLAGSADLNFIRSGYPDYLILDEKGDIIGFVEVKPSKGSKLRPSQERFRRFCEQRGIPFHMWIEGDPLPSIGKSQTGEGRADPVSLPVSKLNHGIG